ncbi:hypothetical protein B0H15DRAFT_811839 [Mycena belliarum]|uniref:Uncharacterized protein n=1 Tax=Mycena belliarum TaxID=1033014 RepID=A0AAD6XXN7_9AGAR|nr:hypothetical protein B0H15DRAFT_811839 [Mycena belliae]
MHYATLRCTVPAPNHEYPPRTRRNTIEPSGRHPPHMIQLVRASQQQQYANEYLDDRSSFVRAQKAEEERIQQDMERAARAQRRKVARGRAQPRSGDVRRPDGVPHLHRTDGIDERGRLEAFQFPRFDTRAQPRPRPLIFPVAPRHVAPMPSPKRLAPLPRFNPFVRARSESLSSVVEGEQPARDDPGKRKRNASVSALFARIHREAEHMRQRRGY